MFLHLDNMMQYSLSSKWDAASNQFTFDFFISDISYLNFNPFPHLNLKEFRFKLSKDFVHFLNLLYYYCIASFLVNLYPKFFKNLDKC